MLVASKWQIPNNEPVKTRVNCYRLESKEFNDAPAMGFGWAVLVLLPFLDCRISNSKSQQFRKLRHGQREVDSLLAEVFSKGCPSGRVVPQSLKVYGFGGFPCVDLANGCRRFCRR